MKKYGRVFLRDERRAYGAKGIRAAESRLLYGEYYNVDCGEYFSHFIFDLPYPLRRVFFVARYAGADQFRYPAFGRSRLFFLFA